MRRGGGASEAAAEGFSVVSSVDPSDHSAVHGLVHDGTLSRNGLQFGRRLVTILDEGMGRGGSGS